MITEVAGELEEILDDVVAGRARLYSVNNHIIEHFRGGSTNIIIFDKSSMLPIGVETSGLPPDMIESYQAYYGAVNPWNAFWPTARPGTVYKSSEHFPAKLLERSEYYCDFLRKIDVSEAVGMVLDDSEDEVISFSTMIPRQMLGREEDMLARLHQRVAPKMTETVRQLRMISQQQGQSIAAAAIAARSPDMAIALDAALRPLMMNQMAELSRGRDSLHAIQNGKLTLRCLHAAKWLQETHRRMSRGLGKPSDGMIVAHDYRHFKVTLTRIPEHDPRAVFHDASRRFLILLQIRDLAARPNGLEKILEAPVFRLTHAERRLAVGLADGLTIAEFAGLHGLSPETVRSQLKSIFAKFNMSRQSELLAFLQRMM